MDDAQKFAEAKKLLVFCVVIIVGLFSLLVWNYFEVRDLEEIASGEYMPVDDCMEIVYSGGYIDPFRKNYTIKETEYILPNISIS